MISKKYCDVFFKILKYSFFNIGKGDWKKIGPAFFRDFEIGFLQYLKRGQAKNWARFF